MRSSINFFLSWKEYFSAHEYFRFARYQLAPERVAGGLLMAISAFWFFLDHLNLLAVIGLAIGMIIVFGLPLIRRWSWKRKWEREPLYREQHEVSYSEEGIRYLMGHVESNLDWKYYQRMLESPDGFLLIYGDDAFNLLPKRAFANDEMINQFRKLAAAKLSHRKRD
jgi:YcxB-like protein